MNKALLRSHIIKNGDTQEKLAEAIGISLSNLSAKINSKGTTFRLDEVEQIRRRYSLTNEDVILIFFAQAVS